MRVVFLNYICVKLNLVLLVTVRYSLLFLKNTTLFRNIDIKWVFAPRLFLKKTYILLVAEEHSSGLSDWIKLLKKGLISLILFNHKRLFHTHWLKKLSLHINAYALNINVNSVSLGQMYNSILNPRTH